MNNKLTNLLLAAILATGVVGFAVSLQPEVEKRITVSAPKVNVTSPDVYPNITVSPADVVLNPEDFKFGSENEYYTGASATSVSVSIVATGTTQVLAANSGRQYARIQNMGNTNVTCQLTSTTSALAVGVGIVLNSSSTNAIFELGPDNLYKGVVRCIASTATTVVSAVDK
jgi:hypothetical protein